MWMITPITFLIGRICWSGEMSRIVTTADVHCYLTLAGSYRAYVRNRVVGYPEVGIGTWATTQQKAIAALGMVLAEKNIPFDFSEPYRRPKGWA